MLPNLFSTEPNLHTNILPRNSIFSGSLPPCLTQAT